MFNLVLEDFGGAVVRRRDGRLAEPHGQYLFDFDASAQPLEPGTLGRTADQWFAEGLFHEDARQWDQAEHAYRQAVTLEPGDSVLRFNLANALYAQGDLFNAMGMYRAAVARDPAYAEAWNNLGIVLSDLGHFESARAAFQQAVRLAPGYMDARFNLAELEREFNAGKQAACGKGT